MPSGKTHDVISIITIPPLFWGLYYFELENSSIISIIMGFLFSCFMFNGDLDTKSRPYNRWLFLKFIWLPYQKLFVHRSIWTHGLIIGTVIRLIYLSPILIPLGIYLNYFENISIIETLPLIIGLELGNTLHTISDFFS